MTGALDAAFRSPFVRRADLPHLEACAGTHAAGVTTHVNDRCLLGVVHRGGIELQVGREKREVQPGGVLIIPAGTATRSRHIGPTTVSVLFMQSDESAAPQVRVQQSSELAPRIASIVSAMRRAEVTSLAIEDALAQVLSTLESAPSTHRFASSEPRAVQRARELLHARFVSGVSLGELAQAAELNKHYLHKAFRDHTGMGPHAYLVSLRVAAARSQIAAGRTLREACERSGFYDQSHMIRAFRDLLGVTPGAYAASLGWSVAVSAARSERLAQRQPR